MTFVDYKKLREIAKKTHHASNAEDTSVVLNEYINLMSNMLNKTKKTDEKELALLTMCLQDWLMYSNASPKLDPDLRAICMVNLGNVYDPEAAYEHPAIVLEKIPNENLVLIVPTKTSAYNSAYDPMQNPTGDKYIIKADQSNNFNGPCGIELKQLRIISTSRIISAKSKIDSNKFQEIKDKLVELYFIKHFKRANLISEDLYKIIKKFIGNNDEKLEEIKKYITEMVEKYIADNEIGLISKESYIRINQYANGNSEKLEEIKNHITETVEKYIATDGNQEN